MLKFIRGKGQQPSAERQKLQKELFSYRKVSKLILIFYYKFSKSLPPDEKKTGETGFFGFSACFSSFPPFCLQSYTLLMIHLLNIKIDSVHVTVYGLDE